MLKASLAQMRETISLSQKRETTLVSLRCRSMTPALWNSYPVEYFSVESKRSFVKGILTWVKPVAALGERKRLIV